MKKKDEYLESDINDILFRRDIGKREKIKQMFHRYEAEYPDEDKETLIKVCIKYYEYKICRKNPDKYYKS